MKKLNFLIAILMISVLVAIAGCSIGQPGTAGEQQAMAKEPSTAPPAPPPPPAQAASGNTIEITASGFSPSTLTIKAGEEVTWVNNGTAPSWPASAMHPTHKVYPGSDIAKCGSPEEASIFDSCKGIEQGDSFKFKFDSNGTWRYHDHLNPSLWGTIVVE